MDLTFRRMAPEEALELRKLGRKSFGPLEALFVSTPQTALVAVLDEKTVGGFVYQFETIGGKKVGFASFLFTDPAAHGQGIGKRLCEEGIRHLWEEGCDALVTFVRDDNVASWGLFKRNGFALASLPKLVKLFGLPGLAKLFVKTTYGTFSIGHDFYVALRNKESTQSYTKEGGAGQVAAYVLINVLFLLFFMLRAAPNMHLFYAMAAGAVVLSGVVLAGYIGTLFSKREWRFRFTSGGGLVYLIINFAIGHFFPLIGNWYPLRYENTPRFRRDMAVNSIAVWVFLLGLIAARVIAGGTMFLTYAAHIASFLLIYRLLPVAVFESSGFWRVFKWNKVVLGLLIAASIALVFVATRLHQVDYH